jgi:hypothetical protein
VSVRGSARCTGSNVNAAMRSTDATLYFGHGTATALGVPTLVDSANVSKAANKLLLAFACKAGITLGGDAISQQVTAFLGFADLVSVPSPPPGYSDPIGAAVNAALTLLVQGKTIKDVHDKLISELKQVETDYSVGVYSHLWFAGIVWQAAHINLRGLTLLGSETATL